MSAFDWSGAPGVWPSLGPDIAKALRTIATMPIERLRAIPDVTIEKHSTERYRLGRPPIRRGLD